MPMSGSCRGSDTGHGRVIAVRGFTLLELLIVLALTAVMVALVAPRLAGTVEAIQISGDRAEVARQVATLPVKARLSGEAVRLDAKASLSNYLQLPEGWVVTLETPLSISALGVCDAADILVTGPRGGERWVMLAPDCRVRESEHG